MDLKLLELDPFRAGWRGDAVGRERRGTPVP